MNREALIKAIVDYARATSLDKTLEGRLTIINELQTKAKQYTAKAILTKKLKENN